MTDDDQELWHYRRVCTSCVFVWGGLHCVHDGYQNNCPNCGVRPESVPDDSDDGCDCEFNI